MVTEVTKTCRWIVTHDKHILFTCIFWFRKNILSLFMATHVWKHNFCISSWVLNPQALQVWHIRIRYVRLAVDTRQLNFTEWKIYNFVLYQLTTSQSTEFITYMTASKSYCFCNRFISDRPKCLLFIKICTRIHNIILHSIHSSIFSSFLYQHSQPVWQPFVVLNSEQCGENSVAFSHQNRLLTARNWTL